MRKTAFLKRLLSIATASMLLASACSTLFTASAETASDSAAETTVYQLLDTENYKAGWNTAGIVQNNLMTGVASGKTLNRVSANYGTSDEVRVYMDCKTPEEAGLDLSAVHSVAYYFKNDAGKALTVNFQNFTDRENPTEENPNGWLTAFGRLMNCTVYLVPSGGNIVKATSSDSSGLVTIPEGFEGYVVYDTDTRTTETSGTLVSDLLTGEYTFGSSMSFTIPGGILKGGDVFYYGEISASTVSAKEFISTLNTSAVYSYAITSGLSSVGLDAGTEVKTEYDSFLDETVTTFAYPAASDEWNGQSIYFTVNGLKDYYHMEDTVSAVSMYVKNPAGHGDLNLTLFQSNNYSFKWGWFSYYDIRTGAITEDKYSQNFVIPAGFEGYVFFNAAQVNSERKDYIFPNICAEVLNSQDFKLYQSNSSAVFGEEISIGSVTAWCGDYTAVKQALAVKSSALSAPMSLGYDSTDSLKSTNVSGVSPDGDCRKYEKLGTAGYKAMYFNLSNTSLGSYALSAEYVSGKEALAVWFKNSSANSMVIGMFEEGGSGDNYHWYSIAPSCRLFDTAKQTVSEIQSGNMSIPAGFEGYIFILLDSTNVTKNGVSKIWKQFVADGDILTSPVLNANTNNLEVGDSYYIGKLNYVKSVDEFIESRLEVTLEGDVNRDGSADILDLVRLKKNAAGVESATVYVPNVSYGGNTDSAATLKNLRKQLLGADYEKAAVSQEVHDRLIPPAEPETDTVTAANGQVGVSIYHLTAGDWDEVYAAEKAESEFINYYPGNDISDVRTAKERGGAAWIGISGSYMNDAGSYQNARANLAKYVETLKAEKLWNTVAGFEFEEITDATNDDPGKLEQLKELSEYLYTTYPEKRQFAVLAVQEVKQAAGVENAYQYVTDIAFDWYAPETTVELRALFETMKLNTGLANAKYWFLPGIYTSTPSAESAAHALAQIDACYELLMQQPADNRGGLYFYNWLTFSNETSTAYGLDQLLNDGNYTEVKSRIFEISAAAVNGKPEMIEISNGAESGTTYAWGHRWMTFNSNWTNMSTAERQAMTTFSYYIENNTSGNMNAFAFMNGDWTNYLVGNASVYNIVTGEVKTYDSANKQFSVPSGFKGYVLYDIANCTVNDGSAAEFISTRTKFNICTGETNDTKNEQMVISQICYSTVSFDVMDRYFKSLQNTFVINDGSSGTWNNSEISTIETVAGVSPNGSAFKTTGLSETGAQMIYFHANRSVDNDLLATCEAFSFWVSTTDGTTQNFSLCFNAEGVGFKGDVVTYDTVTREVKEYSNVGGVNLTNFTGYVIFKLQGSTITTGWGANSYSYEEYIATTGNTPSFGSYRAPNFYNATIYWDDLAFSLSYDRLLEALIASAGK